MATTVALFVLFASNNVYAQAPGCADSSLRLKVDLYELSLNDKKPICVTVDVPFMIIIQNPPGADWDVEAGDVTLMDKRENGKANQYEISGNNSANKNYVLGILTGAVTPGADYEFWINVKNVGTLDPRVRVVDSDTIRRMRYEAALELLINELRMTAEELSGLLRDFTP